MWGNTTTSFIDVRHAVDAIGTYKQGEGDNQVLVRVFFEQDDQSVTYDRNV